MIDFVKDVFFKLWNCPKSMNSLTRIFLICPVLFLIIFLMPWLFSQPIFHLKYLVINVSANDIQHVKSEELKRIVIGKLNGTALTSDLSPIYRSVLSHPWVKEATVRRIWPNKILVNLREHNIIGVWSDGRFISQAGSLLRFDKLQSESIRSEKKCLLLQLDGPPGTVLSVLEKARMIYSKASSIGLQPTSLQLSTQYDWRVLFSNGLKMELGGDNLGTPITERLDNFFNSIDWYRENVKKDLVSVDLRYAQGFAFEERQKFNINKTSSNKKINKLKSCIVNNDGNEVVL